MNKVVARLVDGRILEGTTTDFSPGKDLFHLSVANTPAGGKPVILHTKEMKALFFVKDFSGDPQHVERNAFDASRPTVGRRIQVVFKDGESVGTTTGTSPDARVFFLYRRMRAPTSTVAMSSPGPPEESVFYSLCSEDKMKTKRLGPPLWRFPR